MQKQAQDLDLLNRLFNYDQLTGALTWKERCDVPQWWNTRYAGKKPTNADSLGYLRVKITANGFSGYVSVHRICFYMAHGFLPKVVDHINGDVQDNRTENLRASDWKTNTWNRSANKGTLTGKKGVAAIRYQKGKKKGQVAGYKASIGHNGERIYLGYYPDPESAYEAVREKELELRSEWARNEHA